MNAVDLTHSLATDMPVYPGSEPVRVEPAATREREGYRTTRLDLDSHAGTHVDAPAHLVDGPGLDDLPVDRFRFDAATVRVPGLDPRDAIGRADLRDSLGGDPEAVDLVVVATGWDRHWTTDRYLDHPYLTRDAAEWLADSGCDLGLDTINPDPTPTGSAASSEPDGFPVHRTMFGRGRLVVENLRGLDQVPDRFALHAYPLRFDGSDASPVRAVAHLGPEA